MREILSFFILLIVYIISFYVLTRIISKKSIALREYFSQPNNYSKLKYINYHVYDWEPTINGKKYFYYLNNELLYENVTRTINGLMENKYNYYFKPNIIREKLSDNLKYYLSNQRDEVNYDYLNTEIENLSKILNSFTDDDFNSNFYYMMGDILLNIIDSNFDPNELHIYFIPFVAKDYNIVTVNYKGNNLIFVGLYSNNKESMITYPRWEQSMIKIDAEIFIESKLDCNNNPLPPPNLSRNELFLSRVCDHLQYSLEPSFSLDSSEKIISISDRYSGITLEYNYMKKLEDDLGELDYYKKINEYMNNSVYNLKESQREYQVYIDRQPKRTITLPVNDIQLPKNQYNFSFI